MMARRGRARRGTALWRWGAALALLTGLLAGWLPGAGVARAAATCVVYTTGDAGAGSLRQCLIDVDTGGTIAFALPNLSTITLTSGQLTIGKALTIQGPGADQLTISGSGTGRVFNVGSGVTGATITGLTIAYGNAGADFGGGIYNDGTLTVANVAISANAAAQGGGIFNTPGGTANLTNATINSNTATGAAGGIGNAGTITASNLILIGNAAVQGGGISNVGTLVVTTATIFSNTASGGSDPDQVAGGGILNNGTATLTDVVLTGNSTTNEGGGLYNASTGTLTMTNPFFLSNTATGTSSGISTSGGGGLYNTAGGIVTLSNATISDNTAPNGDGGGISNSGTLTVTGAAISSNTARTGYGGGIANQGPLTVNDATISGNTAVLGVGLMNQTATVTLTNVTISGNTSIPRANGLGGNGGGIYNYFSGTLILTNGTLSGNAVTGTNLFKPAGNLLNDGTATVRNTIVAYSAAGAPCDGGRGITDGGGNLDTGTTCGFTAATSKSSANPLLGALANNGGPTQTHLPGATSPAVGLGVAANCPPHDQRGATRPQGTNCTSGAVQVGVTPLTLAPAALPGGTVGAAYSQQLAASGGGTVPYTYSVAAGTLPAGLTLASNGTLSGTPTTAGTYPVTLRARDTSGVYDGARDYTLVIALAVAPASLPNGQVGVAYSQQLTASGGTAPYTYAVTRGALPAGLALAAGGTLAGTPTAGGSFAFTVTATDSGTGAGAATGARDYTLTIAGATIVVAPASLPGGQVGVAYSSTLTASGGTAPYTYVLDTGTLPAGLTLASNGTLSGTPTAGGPFSFRVRATDGSTGTGPYSGTRDYALTIAAPTIVLAPATLPDGARGVAYSQQLTASGGTAPYTFAVTGGALPAGLTLAAGGTLAGTSTVGGSFGFTVTATDSSTGGGPYTGTRDYTLVIAPSAQALAFPQPPDADYGVPPFVVTATASSGLPVTFGTTTPNVCTVGAPTTGTSATVTIVGVGTCTITADQAGDANYEPAPQVARVFTVLAPAPTLSGVAPATVAAGAADTTVALTGTGFAPGAGSVATLDGQPLATTRVDDTHLTAVIPVAQLATAGQYPLTVTNPAPGGGTSNPVTVTVTNGGPTLGGLSPTGVTAGAPDTALALTGSGFAPGATVAFGGTTLTPDPATASATDLTVTVPQALLVDARTVAVTVTNPGPGGGTSAPQAFTIAPVPAAPAQASVAPANLAFGNQQVGTASDSRQVTLTNGGGSALAISGVTIGGTYPGDFAVTFTTCVGNVPVGGSCVVGVRFAPTAAGDRTATLRIANSAAGSPQTVALIGTGTAPPASPAPQSAVMASASGYGTVTPTGVTSYTTGTTATYAAVPAVGQVFVGWTLDGSYVGYASPLTFTVEADRTLVATFVARPTFTDVSTSDPDYQAITTLAALGIINPTGVNGSGQFQPARDVARAEVAAFLARVFDWENEFHGNSFPDKCDPTGASCVDDRLWNDVAALKDYGVVGGYNDAATCQAAGTTAPCYLPRESVLKVQVVSIVARAFTKAPDLRPTGFWDRLAANPAQYTNVPDAGSQRSDLATYRANAGPIPGQASDGTFPQPTAAATRRFIIQVLWQAYSAQFGTDRVP